VPPCSYRLRAIAISHEWIAGYLFLRSFDRLRTGARPVRNGPPVSPPLEVRVINRFPSLDGRG